MLAGVAIPIAKAKIKAETGATIRAVPLAQESIFSSCVHCGKPATK